MAKTCLRKVSEYRHQLLTGALFLFFFSSITVLQRGSYLPHPFLHIVKDYELPPIKPQKCFEAAIREKPYVSCVKDPKKDLFISGDIIKSGGHFSEDIIIDLMLEAITIAPQAVFVDLGANIGKYTLPIAASGFRVIAVDPVLENLSYINRGLELSGLQHMVTLCANFLSDQYEKSYPWTPEAFNEGGTIMVKPSEIAYKKNLGRPVNSVKLEDILFIADADTVVLKVDTEGHECKVLMDFLWTEEKKKFVPYILVEWVQISGRNVDVPSDYGTWKHNQNCPPEDLAKLVRGFYRSGYKAYAPHPLRDRDLFSLYINVVWVHKAAKPLDQLRNIQKSLDPSQPNPFFPPWK